MDSAEHLNYPPSHSSRPNAGASSLPQCSCPSSCSPSLLVSPPPCSPFLQVSPPSCSPSLPVSPTPCSTSLPVVPPFCPTGANSTLDKTDNTPPYPSPLPSSSAPIPRLYPPLLRLLLPSPPSNPPPSYPSRLVPKWSSLPVTRSKSQ